MSTPSSTEEILKLLDPKESIVGFNYPFSKALLKKLVSLRLEGKVFLDERHLTDLAGAVVNHLCEQFKMDVIVSPDGITHFILCAEEFLSVHPEHK